MIEDIFKKSTILRLTNNGDKPFGIAWTEEDMIKLLESREYKIIDRDIFKVAIREGTSYIPETSNIEEVFNTEVKKTILQFLINNGSK